MKTSVLAGAVMTAASLIFLTQAMGMPRFDDRISHRFPNDEKLSQNIEKLTEGTVARVCGNDKEAIVIPTITFNKDRTTVWVKIIVSQCSPSYNKKSVP